MAQNNNNNNNDYNNFMNLFNIIDINEDDYQLNNIGLGAAAGAGYQPIYNQSGIDAFLNLSNIILSNQGYRDVFLQYDSLINSNNDISDLNDIIDECILKSFDLYNQELQNRIADNELHERSIFFDNFTVNASQISTVKYMLMNGIRNGYSIKDLLANIFAYYSINYPDEDIDNLKNIIIIYGLPIIRRSYARQNIFLSFMEHLNDLNPNEENTDSDNKFLTEKQFDKLTCMKFKEKNSNDAKCAICCDTYELDDDIVELKCSSNDKNDDDENKNPPNHFFHKDCIFEWTTKHHASCPLCRKPITQL